jgi:hypothetical protein
MASEFKLGTDLISDFQSLDQLLSTSAGIDPDWSFRPFSGSIRLGDGTLQGTGFPIAKWRWNGLSDARRQILKDFADSDLSVSLYIRTATNEVDIYDAIVFKTFSCIMNWTEEDEDFQADKVLGLVITFTHLVEQP